MGAQQIPVDRGALFLGENDDGVVEVLDHVAYRRLRIVNVIFVGNPAPNAKDWVLIDAGVMGTARTILRGAENRFGKGARPNAIILTHNHFDHVGALIDLAEEWNVPIYAHLLEQSYLNGSESYRPPDPYVGGAVRDDFFDHHVIKLLERVRHSLCNSQPSLRDSSGPQDRVAENTTCVPSQKRGVEHPKFSCEARDALLHVGHQCARVGRAGC